MKKIVISLALCLVVTFGVVFMASRPQPAQTAMASTYLRIHIRANSNAEEDQAVKLSVKEKIVDFLTPILADCKTLERAHSAIKNNLNRIEYVANQELGRQGFSYVAHARLNDEFFPTRAYGDLVLDEGLYDALIVELGQGIGNNWWCVVYPPLCFVGAEGSGENIVYKSKIMEIINKFFS
ncbi:MAG: stage II sporulation protein R [Clostridia bacterium]|nr:stage II sporulation protein R [Clostridia bacterium]